MGWRALLGYTRAIGPSAALWRATRAARARVGLRDEPALLPPVVQPPHEAWLDAAPAALRRRAQELHNGTITAWMLEQLPDDARASISLRAAQAARGEIVVFGDRPLAFGAPIDWGLDPTRQTRWPLDVPHDQLMRHEARCGDIKVVWELGRFPQAVALVRAYALSGDPAHSATLDDHIAQFIAHNQPGFGPHWASGQEVAVRALRWLWASALLPAPAPAAWRARCDALRTHGAHLTHHLGFAKRLVQNNHLLIEALALLALGRCFEPWWPEARGWRERGWRTLCEATRAQLTSDGAYCQGSWSYHRVALEALLWARWYAPDDDPIGHALLRGALTRGGAHLAALMDPIDGTTPNFGPVDGAWLHPWSETPYEDVRAVLSCARYATSSQRGAGDARHDEALLWTFGPDAPRASRAPWPHPERVSGPSGWLALRRDARTLALLRAGESGLFGHDDPLHLSLRWRGVDLTLDAGSYHYNLSQHTHRWAHGARSHNTLTLAKRGPSLLARRFAWVDRPRFVWGLSDGTMWAAHDGWPRATHRREVSDAHDGWRVIDTATGRAREVTLHWLLPDAAWALSYEAPGHWRLRAVVEGLPVTLRLRGPWHDAPTLHRAVDDGAREVWGWISTRYGQRAPAVSLRWRGPLRGALTLCTELSCGSW